VKKFVYLSIAGWLYCIAPVKATAVNSKVTPVYKNELYTVNFGELVGGSGKHERNFRYRAVHTSSFSRKKAVSSKSVLAVSQTSSLSLLERLRNFRDSRSQLLQKLLQYQKLSSSDNENPQDKTSNILAQPSANITTELQKKSKGFGLFPVGLSVGKRTVNPSVIIRGEEDGARAVNFENWLIPFDDVVQALNLNLKNLPDGQIEVRSPGLVIRIDPQKIRTDPELGLVFSIKDLETLFGIQAKFDTFDYAIELSVPWLNQSIARGQTQIPIQLAGLPLIKPGNFSLTAIEQKLNASGGENLSNNYRGDFIAVGSAFGGSWFLRTDQRDFQDTTSWRIAEAQFLRQGDQTDYIIGSQPTFWRSLSNNDYWGVTYIQRQGFVPPRIFGGFLDPRQRLQAAQVGRTITGTTEPGTLVRLVETFGDRVLGEVLVDSSGVYRFENVKSDNQYLSSSYRVLLYPEGRLTAPPIVREATYSTVPGQIPAGASALVFSGGLRRNNNQNFLGEFDDFRGGVAQRWGLSENITVGLGGIYDDSARGLAELFYRPTNLPLQIAVSALSGSKWDVNADVRYNPLRNLSAAYTRDRFSSRFNLDWRVIPSLSLFATTDSRSATAGGLQLNFSGRNAFTFARISLDTESNLRWSWLQRLGKLELNQRGNEIGTLSELSYNFSRDSSFLNLGNSLLLSYETRAANNGNDLLTMGWRYRSPQRASDGNYLWEAQLGYGIGSQGSGPVATLSTTVLPGILLRGRYQSISVTNDQASFSIDLISSLGLQGRITPGDRRTNYFRTQGGLSIQPFFDRNNNGKHDINEEFYTENPDTLLQLNNRPIRSLQPNILGDRVLVKLHPGRYRLDLDPAGFPEDWQVANDAYAVDVIAGSHTPVLLPLTRSYTLSGVITDNKGQPLSGVRIEAISESQTRLVSVTNTAGVYYLERMQQGNYNLLVDGKKVDNHVVKLEDSPAFVELNIQQLENFQYQAIGSGAAPASVKE
jgi:hypothetical protein